MPVTLEPPEAALRQLAHLFYWGYVNDKHIIDEESLDTFIAMGHVTKDYQGITKKDAGHNYLTLTGKLYAASLARAGDFDKFELN